MKNLLKKMNLLHKTFERKDIIEYTDVLNVVWKDTYLIGKLYRNRSIYYFTYDRLGLKDAEKNNFKRFGCFKKVKKIYYSDEMFEVFGTRIPKKTREDIKELTKMYGLEKYDKFEFLKKTEGELMTDNITFKVEFAQA